MNWDKIICFVMFLSSFILVSCANVTKVKELSSDIHDLRERVDEISNDIDNTLRPEIEQTKNEAIRANQRIDNQITVYHK